MNTRTLVWLLGMRRMRWTALAAVLLVSLWACTSHPLIQPMPDPVQQSDAQVTIVPMRHLDLIFMIDNSPSMEPKQQKMKQQFPLLIEALRDPEDHSLPDLRIAILDSDVGAGASSACGARANGDLGQFQMRDGVACGAHEGARWLTYTKGQPINFTGDVSTVFGCLATNLGVAGCGFEHQLGAFSWAFYLAENRSQWEFLRPEAYLGIVLLTDEDDCSAPSGSRMFNNRERAEAWSLRCATRSHTCEGAKLAYPATAPFTAPYASCRARMDGTCDTAAVDTAEPSECNPLVPVADLADAVKALKTGGDTAPEKLAEAETKILVAGIYGRTRQGDPSTPTYKIDLTPDPTPGMPADATVWDYWPICYDPDFPPAGSGFDKKAAAYGATGGLRLDAFLEQFPEQNRLAYSICEPDFGPAMQGIGDALRNLMGDLCVPYKLLDKREEPGVQADCRVAYRKPRYDVGPNGQQVLSYDESEELKACDAARTPPCWEVTMGNPNGSELERQVAKRCPAKGTAPSQMVKVVRAPGDNLPDGTKAVMQCLTCVDPIRGVEPNKGCTY